MKKSELKNIIKECVKEVIFEDGTLSGIITEVAQGLQVINSSNLRTPVMKEKKSDPVQKTMAETKKRMQEAMNNYKQPIQKQEKPSFAQKNPLFEGTNPLPQGDGKGSLSGVSPSDPGLDIASIPGMGRWGEVASRLSNKKES